MPARKSETKRKNNSLNLSLKHAHPTNPYVNELEVKEEEKKPGVRTVNDS